MSGTAESATSPANTPPPGTNSATATPASNAQPKADAIAGRFAMTCSGCHSLSGVKLNGPELTPSIAWPMDQLKTAIKRMEKNVGPLADEQVTALADLLKAPDVRERIQAQFLAKMAPHRIR